MKKIAIFVAAIFFILTFSSCGKKNDISIHQAFNDIVKEHPEVKTMLLEAIEKGKKINPDKNTNPVQNLDEWYQFIDWSERALPWEIEFNEPKKVIFNEIDQSLDCFYFLLDIPLDSLKDKGYYYNSLEFYPPIADWVVRYTKDYGQYLNQPESWNDQFYQSVLNDPSFNMNKGWYESPDKWHSFNDFFARKLSSPSARPIANPENNSVLTAPADSEPQGIWKIDDSGNVLSSSDQQVSPDGSTVTIKSKGFNSVSDIIASTEYAKYFLGGTLTHTFLNVNDYHRYHFPMSGTVEDAKKIQGYSALGGLTVWDPNQKKYVLYSEEPSWQSIETRACIIIDTPEYGKVALLPVGMSQISSVNINDNIKKGTIVKKGDEIGTFKFGGSDFVMIFQKGVNVNLAQKPNKDGAYKHILMGEKYATLSKVIRKVIKESN